MAKFQGIAPMWIAEFQEIGPIRRNPEIGSGVESRIQRNCFGMDNQQYKLRKVSASLGVSAFMVDM
ncbi:unnamed protein product, partial [Rhizophagus irregularis]